MGKTQNKQDDVLKPNYINNHIMCKHNKRQRWLKWIKSNPQYCCLHKTHFKYKDTKKVRE